MVTESLKTHSICHRAQKQKLTTARTPSVLTYPPLCDYVIQSKPRLLVSVTIRDLIWTKPKEKEREKKKILTNSKKKQ